MAGGEEVVGETPRLRLRRLCLDDVDEVSAMVADPEQMRFYPRSKSRDEVGVWLAWNLAFYEERGFGTWYLEPVFDSAFAGYFGLRPFLLAGRQEVELACHVKKAFWNRGFATEAALRSMQLGFDQFACRVSWRSSTPTTSPRGASRRSTGNRSPIVETALR